MRVVVKERQVCINSHHEGGSYGTWRKTNSYDIESVFVADDDYKLSFDEEGYTIPDGSTKAYVIYMIYGSGNSFGRSSGEGAILGVFGNPDVAQAALKAIKEQISNFSLKLIDDAGREITISNPGAGYFETVELLALETYTVDANTINTRITFN